MVTVMDGSGNGGSCNINVTVDQVSATIHISSNDRISVYPIPTTDILNINIDDSIHVQNITLYNATGQQVLQSDDATLLSLDDLPEGNYLLRIHSTRDVYVTSIVKME